MRTIRGSAPSGCAGVELSKLEFSAEPGFLAQDVAEGMDVWPVLQDLVDAWLGRSLMLRESESPPDSTIQPSN